jgi:hypothetical protein
MVRATGGAGIAALASFLSKGGRAVNNERQADVGGLSARQPVIEGGDDVANLYIPCPVCRAPIAVDEPSEALPRTLTCLACAAVLIR